MGVATSVEIHTADGKIVNLVNPSELLSQEDAFRLGLERFDNNPELGRNGDRIIVRRSHLSNQLIQLDEKTRWGHSTSKEVPATEKNRRDVDGNEITL